MATMARITTISSTAPTSTAMVGSIPRTRVRSVSTTRSVVLDSLLTSVVELDWVEPGATCAGDDCDDCPGCDGRLRGL